MATYKCKYCKEEWEFIAEDYNYKKYLYPNVCAICELSLKDMIEDVFREEGIKGVIKHLLVRIKIFKEGV